MKIADSSVKMTSSRTYYEKYEKNESLKFWTGDERPNFEENEVKSILNPQNNDILNLSDKGKELLKCCEAKEICEEEVITDSETELKIALIETFIKLFSGKEIKISIPKVSKGDNENLKIVIVKEQPQQQEKVGWGLEYDSHEFKYESEKTTFNSNGIIKTVDGREISFSLDLSMSREFIQHTDISLRAGDAKLVDPLVINFSGNAAQLTNTKFSFDIDVDGNEDQISFLNSNSGFLALDKNKDGIINNGSELFGPKSGNGFVDLSEYDVDKNNWIDENDEIYNKLRIWIKDESGNDKLFALGEKGIGAIYLGNIQTEFSVNNVNNEQNGQIKSTGIYIKEEGTVATIQHVNLVV